MLVGIILLIGIAILSISAFIWRAGRESKKQKYYDAAYKIIKENCLNQAICNQNEKTQKGQKLMLCLKWKDNEKQKYVFDPERPIRIGRNPENNDICIREETVSFQHCILFLYQGSLFLQDLNSRNGTWLKRGLSRRMVQGTAPVASGDKIIIGSLTFKVFLFTFDMTYV